MSHTQHQTNRNLAAKIKTSEETRSTRADIAEKSVSEGGEIPKYQAKKKNKTQLPGISERYAYRPAAARVAYNL